MVDSAVYSNKLAARARGGRKMTQKVVAKVEVRAVAARRQAPVGERLDREGMYEALCDCNVCRAEVAQVVVGEHHLVPQVA